MPPKELAAGLVGVRRSGKTCHAIAMSAAFHEEEVLYYNFEDPLFLLDPSVEHLDGVLTVAEQFRSKPIACLVLDEIQNVEGWERWLRKRIAEQHYRIVVTGSSAKLLSRELGTALSGRCLRYEIWPLSFAERMRFEGREEKQPRRLLAALQRLMRWGAFPEVVGIGDELTQRRLLRQYLGDIVLRDVMTRNEVRNKRGFDQVLTYYMTNLSSLHSYTSIRKAFGINAGTVADYTDALNDAFCVFEMQRYHPNLKTQARDPKKVYVIDPGLRNEACRSAQDDTGKILENLVYLELRRRERELSYYQGKQEVDFIITDRYKPVQAIQVCASDMQDPKTWQREVASLRACMKDLQLGEGTIITWNREERIEEDGIRIDLVPAYRWLLGESEGT